jgi:uncharacterized protein (TIGR00730 family)
MLLGIGCHRAGQPVLFGWQPANSSCRVHPSGARCGIPGPGRKEGVKGDPRSGSRKAPSGEKRYGSGNDEPPRDTLAVGMSDEAAETVSLEESEPSGHARRSEEDIARELVAEIATTAEKMLRDRASVADIKLVNRALKEMRWAFHVFARYRSIRKVSVFGSARTPEGSAAYVQAREFAKRVAERGYMLITGAGPGIMRACQEGSGRERSFGINIRLPFEQAPNEFIQRDPKLVNFKYFFTRKLMFVKEADAIVLFPGGFGTHDEGFESLTLLQTGKAKPMPVVFIDAPGGTYWETWHRYVEEHLLAPGLISTWDMRFFRVTDDLDEAIAEIEHFYERYHSSRYVGDHLVIRMSSPLPEDVVRTLDEEFRDIVARGRIEQRAALPEENAPELAHLPRLVFSFARRHFGRLRVLIDRINDA